MNENTLSSRTAFWFWDKLCSSTKGVKVFELWANQCTSLVNDFNLIYFNTLNTLNKLHKCIK